LIVMPIVGVMETPLPLPRSITEAVLGTRPASAKATVGSQGG
jgi:hypothetical protein